MDFAQPPAKRPRTDPDESESQSLPEYTRSTPWFEDGNIVLETERVQFKVYKGILAANSAIFRDMFTIAQAQEVELADGCPVVHLADKPRYLEHIFHFAYVFLIDRSTDGMKTMILKRGRSCLLPSSKRFCALGANTRSTTFESRPCKGSLRPSPQTCNNAVGRFIGEPVERSTIDGQRFD